MIQRPEQRNHTFITQRRRLIGIAYRMLGSMHDAEDVVQDCYLRWQASTADVEQPAAFLRKTTINLCLDRLRARQRSRIDYVGPWLPEPYIEASQASSLDNPEALVTGLSTAFMLVLERLTPLQRAVYLSKQVLGLSHGDIAELLGISAESSRTHHHRAQQALSAEQGGRFDVDPDEHRQLLERFMFAVGAGDVAGLQELLTGDVTCYADGGGKMAAASRPFSGVDAVIKYVLGTAKLHPEEAVASLVPVNDSFGIYLQSPIGDSLLTVTTRGNKLSELFIQRNPDKLDGLKQRFGARPADAESRGGNSGEPAAGAGQSHWRPDGSD